MSWEESWSRHRYWIFYLIFCYSSTCLYRFYRFGSDVRPFHGAHLKWGHIFRLSLHFCGCFSFGVFISKHPAANTLSKPSFPITSAWWRKENALRFRWFHTCSEDLGNLFCSNLFFYTVIIHPWLAVLQSAL